MAFSPQRTDEADRTFRKLQGAAMASLRNRQRHKRAKASRDEGHFKQVEKCVRLLFRQSEASWAQRARVRFDRASLRSKVEGVSGVRAESNARCVQALWGYGPEEGEIIIIAITLHP